MSKYTIATFIVGWATGFICYLIGYMVGITHDKRTITHECVKDTHDKDEPQKDCLTCRYNSDEWDSPKCDNCSKAHSHYEPEADCSWK